MRLYDSFCQINAQTFLYNKIIQDPRGTNRNKNPQPNHLNNQFWFNFFSFSIFSYSFFCLLLLCCNEHPFKILWKWKRAGKFKFNNSFLIDQFAFMERRKGNYDFQLFWNQDLHTSVTLEKISKQENKNVSWLAHLCNFNEIKSFPRSELMHSCD